MKKINAIITKLEGILAEHHPELTVFQNTMDDAILGVEEVVRDNLAVFLFVWPQGSFCVHGWQKDKLVEFPEFSDDRIVYRLDDGDDIGGLLGGPPEDAGRNGLAKVRKPKR